MGTWNFSTADGHFIIIFRLNRFYIRTVDFGHGQNFDNLTEVVLKFLHWL